MRSRARLASALILLLSIAHLGMLSGSGRLAHASAPQASTPSHVRLSTSWLLHISPSGTRCAITYLDMAGRSWEWAALASRAGAMRLPVERKP